MEKLVLLFAPTRIAENQDLFVKVGTTKNKNAICFTKIAQRLNGRK